VHRLQITVEGRWGWSRFTSCLKLGEEEEGQRSAVCVGVSRGSSHRAVRSIKTSCLSSAEAGSSHPLAPSWVLHPEHAGGRAAEGVCVFLSPYPDK